MKTGFKAFQCLPFVDKVYELAGVPTHHWAEIKWVLVLDTPPAHPAIPPPMLIKTPGNQGKPG